MEENMKKWLLLFIALIPTIVWAAPAEDLAGLGRQYIDERCKFYPVWATSIGVHTYDSCLTIYSAESIYQYRNVLADIGARLQDIDTLQLSIDDKIDYRLLQANIDYDNFNLLKYPIHVYSPAVYVEDALNSLYYLLLDNSLTRQQRDYFLIVRLRRFPVFFRDAGDQLGMGPQVYYETAIETARDGLLLVDDIINELMKTYPDSVGILAQTRTLAKEAIKTFKMACENGIGYAQGTPAIGKQNYNYLLKNVHFISMDSDSLKKIGQRWYRISNAAMDSLKNIIATLPPENDSAIIAPDTFDVDDIMAYYQWEINQGAQFLKDNDIVSIPDDIGACIPIQMPSFMQATHRGIAYEPPPAFAKNQTGYFYVRPIPPLDSIAKNRYYRQMVNRTFKGSVVHEAYPGHHLQLSLANRHRSDIRKIQGDLFFCEGWALYCEQMTAEQGYYSDQELARRWNAIWGGIRFRAVRVIVDCSIHDGTMTPDSALAFMNAMLGDHTDYYVAEIRRYCANPTTASSYLIGKLMILDILDKAKKRDGKAFSLKKFHDSILAEGTIPPKLIAKKVGY
jgi:uncharacterized protein (DUF885 family)